MPESIVITVNQRGAERIRNGHLWVYRSDLQRAPPPEAGGAIARVTDARGKFLAQAFYSSRSEIAVRVLTTEETMIDRAWWRARLCAAAARRDVLRATTNAYRMVYSEGDLMSSVIIDRYNDVFVLQTLSQGAERIKPLLVELLAEEFAPRAVIERNDVKVRQFEDLPLVSSVLYGDAPASIAIEQNGVRFLIEPLGGQKTGTFLDQRENRLAAQHHAVRGGRALDCFTFNGAFALHLARVSSQVIALDISAAAVEQARRNAALNELSNIEFRELNVFDALRELENAGERFDTIVLDPPAFAKNRQSVKAAARGYKEINLRALKLLRPNGVLITCTCSYHLSEAQFLELIAAAARDAQRQIQLIEKRIQASDHPILLNVPETYYLKCAIVRVIG